MIKIEKKLAKNVPFCPACGSENLNNLFELQTKFYQVYIVRF